MYLATSAKRIGVFQEFHTEYNGHVNDGQRWQNPDIPQMMLYSNDAELIKLQATRLVVQHFKERHSRLNTKEK